MSKINPDVITFYKELSENNTREWFEPQKKRFKSLELEIKQYAEEIKNNLNETDEIEHAKIFRIYRDVRFSKNKTPFKTHFGISFHRKKPDLRGGYYIHISPGNSFIATGFWNPDKDDLYRIRKEVEMDAEEIQEIRLAKSGRTQEDEEWGSRQRIRLLLQPHGRLTVFPMKSTSDIMSAHHPALGELNINLHYAGLMEFSFGSSILDSWDDDY